MKTGISLTAAAAAHVKSILAQHPEAAGFRVAVKKTGCSGYRYIVGLAGTIEKEDTVFAQDDITVVINKVDLEKLDGTKVDFVAEGLNRHFKFNNPKADHYCGCGESFTLKTSNEGENDGD